MDSTPQASKPQAPKPESTEKLFVPVEVVHRILAHRRNRLAKEAEEAKKLSLEIEA